MIAETTLRELGRPSTEELLLLTALICQKQPERGRRVSARFVARYLETADCATIDEVSLIVSLLAALGGPRHDQVLAALLDIVGRPSSATNRPERRSA